MSILAGSLNENSARTALVSEGRAHGVTYGQLDDCSGRIYSWLKSHGFGREDFILICLPRGIRTVVSMIGILKAGAAYTVVENTYSPDRIEFIKKDCGCSLVIDEVMFLEMMRADFLGGYETTDPHDAAFVIYTSGTTGNPKGAVHEYGQLDKLYVSHIYSVHRDHDGVGMKRGAYENLIDLGTDGAESPIVSTLGLNGFFALSIALATASLNNYRKQSVFCVFNGRSSAISANIFGLLFKAPPVYFDFEKGRSVGEVVEKARESISEAIAYSFYPFNSRFASKPPT